MYEQQGRAVVLGAGIAGLLAARVLAESFATVTVLERDTLPSTPDDRKGVPQGTHLHGMLARGKQILEQLFPGLTEELVASGAGTADLLRDSVWNLNGHRLPRVASGVHVLCVSRALLEHAVRRRVAAMPNVTILDRTEVVGLTGPGTGTVTAVRTTNGEFRAGLVVDATGRANRSTAWLAELGFEPPAEDRVDAGIVYMSRTYRRRRGDADFAGIFMGPSPERPYGANVLAVDGDRWMVVLLGVGPGNAPPEDPDGYLEFANRLPGPEVHRLLSRAEPLEAPHRLRVPVSVRRRYEMMPNPPVNVVAIGDAICSFNPAYGQGMTVAAIEAAILRDCLAGGRAGLTRRYYREAAKTIDVPWDIAVGSDLRFAHVEGKRTGKAGVLNGYVARLSAAASTYPELGAAFLEVSNMIAPPTRLFAPAVLRRVLRGGRPQRTTAPEPAFETV